MSKHKKWAGRIGAMRFVAVRGGVVRSGERCGVAQCGPSIEVDLQPGASAMRGSLKLQRSSRVATLFTGNVKA